MKTRLIVLGVILVAVYYWYKNIQHDKAYSGIAEGQRVKVRYTGPVLQYTGLQLRSGDIIEGIYHSNGAVSYEFSGNGIVASSKVFVIPSGDYEIIG